MLVGPIGAHWSRHSSRRDGRIACTVQHWYCKPDGISPGEFYFLLQERLLLGHQQASSTSESNLA